MKRIILFLLIFSCNYSYSQTVNILYYQEINFYFENDNYGNYQDAINEAYESVGFNVNLTTSDIDSSLNTNNYDVLILKEWEYFQWLFSINESQRQIVENFILDGGHVVWSSESYQPNAIHNSNITINNIFGTNLQDGPHIIFFDEEITKIHPSSGPVGLSLLENLNTSGHYSSILNVPNCNKIYSVPVNPLNNILTNFDLCSQTVISIFPAEPTPDQGSVILSNEVQIPFHSSVTFSTITNSLITVSNIEFDSTIALLHYHLLVDQDLAFNQWANDSSNFNSDCPPTYIDYNYSDSIICLGDSIRITTNTDILYFTPTSSGIYNLNNYFQDGSCSNNSMINVQILSVIAEVPNDTSICFGESYIFSALNTEYDNASWNNGVINNQAYTPTQEQYYSLTIENNGCIGKDSVYVSFKETPELTLSITSDSICRGDQVFINVSSQNPLTSIQWENGIVNNQGFRPDSSTTYIARATLSNCSTKDSIDLFVGEYPIVNTIDDFTLCKEGLISLYAETSEDAIISWSDGIENGIPFLINESSVYYVSANLNNCISQESVMIELISNVKADFDYTLEPYSNSELKGIFKNYSSQGDSIEYYWEFINDLNTSTNFEPNYIFNNDREFVDVSLLVSNQYGCKDSIVKTIQIYLLYIPNTFTPNYDQTNDLFKPILSLLPREYEFTIYTRWGEQIFKTNDYKDGWDGIYNGNLVGDGVYTLKLLINNKAYTQSFTVMSAN
ncbi:MAG: gliding motility-associated C-terminal domain-containing protein [Flavobacteriales bacterium]